MSRDGYAGLVVLVASVALFWTTLGLKPHPLVPVGPGFYPRVVLGITGALGALLLVLDLLAMRRRTPAAPSAERVNYVMVLVTFGIFGAYVLLLPYLGFRVGTVAFMVAMQFALERPRTMRRWIGIVVAAVATTVAAYLLFEQYLKVLLPRGDWTDF